MEGIVFSTLVATGSTLAGSAFAIAAITGAVSIGLSIGLSYLASSIFAPKAPKPEDVQQSVKNPISPRMRHYGRVKVSGPWTFAEAKGGDFYKVLAIGQGPIDAVEEYWLDDTKVTLNVDGGVVEEPWASTGTPIGSVVQIKSRLGAATETHYSELASVFPEWTSDHRGDGVASLYAKQFASGQEFYLSRFPSGVNTNYRLVIRSAQVKNPVTSATEWNDNAAAVIRDYVVHKDGMRLPESIVSTPLAQAGWVTAYNRAATNIATKAGSEPRYRLWGSYSLEERPADVLGRMMASCDGRLVPTPDGGLTLDIGEWQEPTVTIDESTIVGFSEVGRGRDVLTSANTIRAKYLDPAQDYQGADADPWVDAADVGDRGEIATDMEFIMAPSHSQARRLMKLAAFRANPSWVGQFQCNLGGLAAFGERFVRISFPKFGINSVFEVQDFRFNIGEGGILQGVTLQVQSMPSAAYDWNAAQEEGDAPVYDETEVDNTVPVPDAPTVDILAGPIAHLSFSPSPSAILSIEARYKITSSGTWNSIPIEEGTTTADSSTLVEDEEYEFQLRYVTEKGRAGDWSASTVVIADSVP
ncbi:fibronectin type III domain-containing protein [Borborobacter arsenicus]|uniref:fibronectin type III domain-containing protein n=1 Tax=Borborobacter arsenicus TaxID=1851146 RepID=UPI003CCB5EF3